MGNVTDERPRSEPPPASTGGGFGPEGCTCEPLVLGELMDVCPVCRAWSAGYRSGVAECLPRIAEARRAGEVSSLLAWSLIVVAGVVVVLIRGCFL